MPLKVVAGTVIPVQHRYLAKLLVPLKVVAGMLLPVFMQYQLLLKLQLTLRVVEVTHQRRLQSQLKNQVVVAVEVMVERVERVPLRVVPTVPVTLGTAASG